MSEISKYSPNSHKSKTETEERKQIEKVVTGSVKTKKKSELRKFTDIFIAEDVSSVKNYVLMEVLVPAFKKIVSDVVRDSIDIILYGSADRSKRSTNASYVSYNRFSDNRDTARTVGTQARIGYNYADITLDNRSDAEEVLSRMDELIEQYGIASVADLYDLVGIAGNYTDNKYGWTNLRNADIMRVRDGYMLRLPKALPLN